MLNARARQVIEAGMDKIPAAVTKGVLLGDTTGIESGLYENIRYGGVAHIFAVSGLHVGALFAFCLLLMKKTGLKRAPALLQFILTASVLFLYAGMCAFTPSVVRATVMCLVGYMCKLVLVKSDFLQSLGLSAIAVLFFTPSSLFTAGFQLSFSACFGIAFLAKPIGQVFDEVAKGFRYFFPQKPTPAEIEAMKNDDTMPPRLSTRAYRAVSSFLAVSISAQIFTAPFLLYYFGYVSGWALSLNCIFVPFISMIFSLLLVAVVLACLLPTAWASVLLFAPNALWSAVLLLFEAVDFTSFALEIENVSISMAVVYILGFLFCTDKWNVSKWTRFALAMACFCAFGVGMYALNV
jgi:competence protein ComEC